jgi:photosystem II stability/assembly factor-like uncharacterized protein
MKQTLSALSLILILSLNLPAQEKRVTDNPVTVKVTSNDMDESRVAEAIVPGGWGSEAMIKTPTRRADLQSADGWISLSPPPIGETLNDVHTFNENAAIIIGDRGAVYKTTDRGSTWTKISSGITSNLNALFFLDEKIGWIVGESGKILKTEDAGDSWRIITTNLYTLYDVFFTDANVGYLITSSRIYKTTDGGDNWVEKCAASDVTFFFESIAFSDANTGVAVGTWGRTYRTTDAGETWQKIETGGATWMYAVQFFDATHGWIAGLRASSISITVGGLFGGTTIDITDPRYTIWETTNGGATWTQRNFTYSGRLYGIQFLNATTGWTVGTNGAVFSTKDGGATWGVAQSVHDMYAVHFFNAQAGWAVGADGTILQSSNGGNLWLLQSGNGTTASLYSTHFIDSQTGWAAGYDGKMLRTIDGGQSWFEQSFSSTNNVTSVFFLDDQKGYATLDWWYPRYTTNGGISWNTLTSTSSDGLNCVFFVDKQNGWVVGKKGTINHTTTAGTTYGSWSSQTSGTSEELNAVYFVDALNGWAVGDKGTIIHTTDGGTTWAAQSSGLTNNLESAYFIDGMNGFIAGSSGIILRTTDGGANWTAKRNGESSLNSIYFSDGQNGWAVGSSGTILRTTDGGRTWGLQNSGTTNTLEAVHLIDSQTGYIAGWNGTILKTTTGGGNILYPPALASPLDASTEVSPGTVLSWNACPGALSYRLQVSTNPNLSYDIDIDQSSLAGTSHPATGLLNNTKYYWRVNTTYRDGTSNWSDVWSFTTIIVPPAVPTLSSPSNSATDQSTTIELDWDTVEGAKRYIIQVAKDTQFSNIVFADSTYNSSSWGLQIGPLEINTTYYWHVKAGNNFAYSAWSDTWSFTTIAGPPSAPVLSYPTDRIDNQMLTLWLDWELTSGAERYRLQIATDSIFTIIIFDDSSISWAGRQVESLAIGTTYYWRVSARNVLGYSPWSDVWKFTTISGPPAEPGSPYPNDGSIVHEMDELWLYWGSTPGAERYRLQVATDSMFSSCIVDDSTITWSGHEIGPLGIGTAYYWRVRARNVLGSGPWSSVWKFTTISGPPSAPILTSPANGYNNQTQTVRFYWNAIIEAESCRLQVATDSLFKACVFDDSTITWWPRNVGPLATNTIYYWRVRAKNVLGFSPWSAIWSFGVMVTNVQKEDELPIVFALEQNYPNPFNPVTTIKYQLPRQTEVRLEIYNIIGELMKIMVDEKQDAGLHSVSWNGLDEHGSAVTSGVYLYHLKAGEFVQVRKMSLVR